MRAIILGWRLKLLLWLAKHNPPLVPGSWPTTCAVGWFRFANPPTALRPVADGFPARFPAFPATGKKVPAVRFDFPAAMHREFAAKPLRVLQKMERESADSEGES